MRGAGKAARMMVALSPFGLGAPAAPSTDERVDLLNLIYSLDGEPFVHVTARANIDTLTLGYSLDGQPFIGVSP